MKTYMIEMRGSDYYAVFSMEAASGEIGECVKRTYALRDDLYRMGFKDVETTYTEIK